MNREDIAKVLKQYPTLNSYGFGHDGLTEDSLLNYELELNQIAGWLSKMRKTEACETDVEDLSRQTSFLTIMNFRVSHGVIIAAAVHCGFKVQRSGEYTAYLNVNINDVLAFTRVAVAIIKWEEYKTLTRTDERERRDGWLTSHPALDSAERTIESPAVNEDAGLVEVVSK